MSLYEDYREKASLCRECSRKATSEWAKKFWNDEATKLEIMAGNLPLLSLEARKGL